MTANSGIGASLPIISQANAGDIFVLQTNSGNSVYIHNGLGWQLINSSPLIISGRITANAVGADALSLATLAPLTPVSSTITPTGDVATTAFTLTGLPATATMVAFTVNFSCATVGAIFRIYDGSSHIVAQVVGLGSTITIGMLVPCKAGASNQLQYSLSSTSGAGSTLTFFLSGYVEPT